MDDKTRKFLDLAKKFEFHKEAMKAAFEELTPVMGEIGIGSYLQDPEDLVVYKIVSPAGRFVEYQAVSYERTSKEGEKRGTLSKKDAQEAGFTLAK